ncbi:23S rRNA (adenine2503-C2)-methyltransferase [Entomortierella parvispora]|uniref:23S rRNA (Adenine2503-C2)-methyltransferase n=1 Tax=Entomortierella parvispora TaxID=205924 RepID=A0A9P3H862_9FUNG|nr:23S rRNA (adenine2503-C2)-methyltransferase [Entomortierella parvispora]
MQCQLALFSTKRSEHPKRPKTFDSTSHRNKPVSQPLDFSLSISDHTAPVRDWNKKNLIGLSKQQLKEELETIAGTKSYTADQIWRFIYQRGVTSIDDMLNIPKGIKDDLKEKYTIDYGRVVSDLLSPTDGTRKLLVGFKDAKAMVESVFIPMVGPRGTQCISSQVGCSLACTFCHTGTQKLLRNLTPGEIIGQYMIPAKDYGDLPLAKTTQRRVNNIVFMGQGEPLYNWRNVKQAIEILTDKDGIAMPKSKITLSTSGVASGLPKLAELGGIGLAISLHATNDRLRDEIVPINKTFPLPVLLAACKDYAKAMEGCNRDSQRITFDFQEARALAELLMDIPSHVNLIPFNPWPGSKYVSSPRDHIIGFSRIVENMGIPTTIRWPRGLDIMGACGQLRTSHEQQQQQQQ